MFWQINPQKIQSSPSCPHSSREHWLVNTAWMIKSPHKCALRINSLQRSHSQTRCSLRFHPAANRSVPTERKIEGAINSCKVIYLKDSPKLRQWVLHKRSIVQKGTLCRDRCIVPGEDKESERKGWVLCSLSERIERYSRFPTEGRDVVICSERAFCLNFWTRFVSFPESDNKEELTFLI